MKNKTRIAFLILVAIILVMAIGAGMEISKIRNAPVQPVVTPPVPLSNFVAGPIKAQAVTDTFGIDGEIVPAHWSRNEMNIICDAVGADSPVALRANQPFTVTMYLDYRIRQGLHSSAMSYPATTPFESCNGVRKHFAYSWLANQDMPFVGEVLEEFKIHFEVTPITTVVLISDTHERWIPTNQVFYIMDETNQPILATEWTPLRSFLWLGGDKWYYVYLPVIFR